MKSVLLHSSGMLHSSEMLHSSGMLHSSRTDMQAEAAPPSFHGRRHGVPLLIQSARLQCFTTHSVHTLALPSSSLPSLATLPLRLHIFNTYNGVHTNSDSNNIKVQFVLRRACQFGQQFNVIGADPILGAWNPQAAIPMKWSEGHIWTTELDVPVGKQFEFKFILIGEDGHIEWQPGPNRTFKTLQTYRPLVIERLWEFERDSIAVIPMICSNLEASTAESFRYNIETSSEISFESTVAVIGEVAKGAATLDTLEEKFPDVTVPTTTCGSTQTEAFPSTHEAISDVELNGIQTEESPPNAGSEGLNLEASTIEYLQDSNKILKEKPGDSATGTVKDLSITEIPVRRKSYLLKSFLRFLVDFWPSASVGRINILSLKFIK